MRCFHCGETFTAKDIDAPECYCPLCSEQRKRIASVVLDAAPLDPSQVEGLYVKPKKRCVQCGGCCLEEPCELAGGHDPCIALHRRDDGTYTCKLIELNLLGVREYLGVGLGCLGEDEENDE